jgi:hypothetical protein
LFGEEIGDLRTPADFIFLLIAHSDPSILVKECDPGHLAEAMVNATMYEQRSFFGYYRAFKFGFPDRHNQTLENAEDLLRSRLSIALAGKRTHIVSHPYGGPLENLFRAMEPYCSSPADD